MLKKENGNRLSKMRVTSDAEIFSYQNSIQKRRFWKKLIETVVLKRKCVNTTRHLIRFNFEYPFLSPNFRNYEIFAVLEPVTSEQSSATQSNLQGRAQFRDEELVFAKYLTRLKPNEWFIIHLFQ